MSEMFVTDFGQDLILGNGVKVVDRNGNPTNVIPRYGVWKDNEVIWTSSTLKEINDRYGELPVVEMRLK